MFSQTSHMRHWLDFKTGRYHCNHAADIITSEIDSSSYSMSVFFCTGTDRVAALFAFKSNWNERIIFAFNYDPVDIGKPPTYLIASLPHLARSKYFSGLQQFSDDMNGNNIASSRGKISRGWCLWQSNWTSTYSDYNSDIVSDARPIDQV